MLTPEQRSALKTWVDANLQNPTEHDVRAALNALASPEFLVWKTSVTRREILQNGFDWTRLDNLSVGKARVWQDIFAGIDGNGEASLNPSKINVRTGIESVWVGTQLDLNVRAAVFAHCHRPATVAERQLRTVVANDGTSAIPGTMTFEGETSLQDAIDILNS